MILESKPKQKSWRELYEDALSRLYPMEQDDPDIIITPMQRILVKELYKLKVWDQKNLEESLNGVKNNV